MVKYIKYFVVIILIIALFSLSCTSSVESDNPAPAQVRIVEKSAEDAIVEKGIDAIAFPGLLTQNSISLQWYSEDDEDLTSFDIYRSQDSVGTFPLLTSIVKQFGKIDTFYVDKNVAQNVRYYYYVIARDAADQESPRSIKVNYKLSEMTVLNSPSESDTSYTGIYSWDFPSIGPDEFIFRLERDIAGNFVHEYINQLNRIDYNPHQEWNFTSLGLGNLAPGIYRWRIDIIGADNNEGSESFWQGFQVQ
jgi:hypothetical protein